MYVLHCVYSGVSVDCFNEDYHHQTVIKVSQFILELMSVSSVYVVFKLALRNSLQFVCR